MLKLQGNLKQCLKPGLEIKLGNCIKEAHSRVHEELGPSMVHGEQRRKTSHFETLQEHGEHMLRYKDN